MHLRRIPAALIGIFVAAGAPTSLLGQSPSPSSTGTAFEAASIKRNTSGQAPFLPVRFQGASFIATNVPLEAAITAAYGVRSTELVGGPAWIRVASRERFDITARAAAPPSSLQQQLMLRRLLEERFALRVHSENREMPVYVLMKGADGQLGPNLRPSVENCSPSSACAGSTGLGRASYRAAEWPFILRLIATPLDRRLIDRTGLGGTFDIELTYGQGLSTDSSDSSMDIFTAVRRQLGLRLMSERVPMEVLVIDSVSRPTPD